MNILQIKKKNLVVKHWLQQQPDIDNRETEKKQPPSQLSDEVLCNLYFKKYMNSYFMGI